MLNNDSTTRRNICFCEISEMNREHSGKLDHFLRSFEFLFECHPLILEWLKTSVLWFFTFLFISIVLLVRVSVMDMLAPPTPPTPRPVTYALFGLTQMDPIRIRTLLQHVPHSHHRPDIRLGYVVDTDVTRARQVVETIAPPSATSSPVQYVSSTDDDTIGRRCCVHDCWWNMKKRGNVGKDV